MVSLSNVLGQPVDVVDRDRAGGAEVADVGEVRPLADIHRLDQLRDHEIDIGIALPVAMGRHVDGHAVDLDGEIGAVVEIEAAQKILVGFAFAGMLGDDQPGTTSSASPGREKGWAFTSAPLMVMALAAVGCMYAGPAVADPDVTPLLTCGGTGALG